MHTGTIYLLILLLLSILDLILLNADTYYSINTYIPKSRSTIYLPFREEIGFLGSKKAFGFGFAGQFS